MRLVIAMPFVHANNCEIYGTAFLKLGSHLKSLFHQCTGIPTTTWKFNARTSGLNDHAQNSSTHS